MIYKNFRLVIVFRVLLLLLNTLASALMSVSALRVTSVSGVR